MTQGVAEWTCGSLSWKRSRPPCSESDRALSAGGAALLTGVGDEAAQVRAASGCHRAGAGVSALVPGLSPGGFSYSGLCKDGLRVGPGREAGRRQASVDGSVTPCWSSYRCAD